MPMSAQMMLFWFSMLMSPGLITMGILGPIFGLSVNESIVLTVFASCIGSVIPAFTATLCAPLGLRQIATSRYAFGIWGSKFCGLLNIIVNIGFGTINCIVAGQLLSAVSGGSLTIVVGIVVVCVGAFVISFFGFRWIQRYESVAWFLIFIFLCVEFGQSARYFTPTPGLSYVTGLDRTGAALTYFAIVFGESAAWCSMTGDYYVHYPPDVNKWLVFGMTWTGLALPTVFALVLGNCYGGIVQTNETLSNVYDEGGIGALILATMRPSGWAKFVCVMYTLSFSKSVMSALACLRVHKLFGTNSLVSGQCHRHHLLLVALDSALGKAFPSGATLRVEHLAHGRHPGPGLGRTRPSRVHLEQLSDVAGLLDHLLWGRPRHRGILVPTPSRRLRQGGMAGSIPHALGSGRLRQPGSGDWRQFPGHGPDMGKSIKSRRGVVS